MKKTYSEYTNNPDYLTIETMNEIYETILKESNLENEDFMDIWLDIIKNSIEYTSIRAQWGSLNLEEKHSLDEKRSRIHDSILIGFLTLERLFLINEWDSLAWSKLLFLQDFIPNRTRKDINQNRKRIGDFANYLVFIHAINNR